MPDSHQTEMPEARPNWPIPPVPVYPREYRGRDPKRLQRYAIDSEIAARLQAFLCSRYVKGQPQCLTYFDIECETGIAKEKVYDLLYHIYGGNNGITF